jgi:hypothetical protein
MPPRERSIQLGLLTAWLAALGSWAVGATPEEVLRAKGLTRVGSVYLLGEDDDLKDRIAEVRRRSAELEQEKARFAEGVANQNRMEHHYQDVLQKQQALEAQWPTDPKEKDRERPRSPGSPGAPPSQPPPPPPGGPGPPPPVGGGGGGPPPGESRDPFDRRGRIESRRPGMPREEIVRSYEKLQTERGALEPKIIQGRLAIDRVARLLETESRALERRRAETLARYDELKTRYAALAAESDVAQALSAADSPRPALGPRPADAAAVETLANGLPATRGGVPDHRPGIELKGMSLLTGLAGAAETLFQDLGVATRKLQALEHDVEFRAGVIERTPHTEDPAKLSKLRADQAQARQAVREGYTRLAATRDDYLRALLLLGAGLEAASGRRDESGGDSQARREILSLGLRDKAAPILAPEHVARRFQELDKTVHTDAVPLDRDRTLLWVDATLNGNPGHAMIVDPAIEDVRLPARIAAEAGVQPSDGGDESLVAIPLEGGRTVRARRARLASVQLGPVSAADVECLVLPPEYGDAPAVLGNGFLKRFASHTDPEAGTLSLTHVQLKPPSRASKPATAKASRPPAAPGRSPAGDAPPAP